MEQVEDEADRFTKNDSLGLQKSNQQSSYRPISLLPITSKLIGKILLKPLKPIIEKGELIPDHQ